MSFYIRDLNTDVPIRGRCLSCNANRLYTPVRMTYWTDSMRKMAFGRCNVCNGEMGRFISTDEAYALLQGYPTRTSH